MDPVTRAPEAEANDTTSTTIPSRGPDSTFSFRLRSAEKRESISIDVFEPPPIPESKAFHRAETPPSILSNPIHQPRQPRLLPNPMSTSLLDPSVPAIPASQTVTGLTPQSAHLAARPHQSPFHLQKTLILDLDETLIHSTSRPLSYAASAGGGLLGLSFGGLLGGRKSRKEGHTVEVVLNGRSTTYHVYKRPHVDQFLKKVGTRLKCRAEVLGRLVVHTGHLHRVDAGIRRSSHRMARRRTRIVCKEAVPRKLPPPNERVVRQGPRPRRGGSLQSVLHGQLAGQL